jgi:hypothetical protein
MIVYVRSAIRSTFVFVIFFFSNRKPSYPIRCCFSIQIELDFTQYDRICFCFLVELSLWLCLLSYPRPVCRLLNLVERSSLLSVETCRRLVYADDVNWLGKIINTIYVDIEPALYATNEAHVVLSAERTKCSYLITRVQDKTIYILVI